MSDELQKRKIKNMILLIREPYRLGLNIIGFNLYTTPNKSFAFLVVTLAITSSETFFIFGSLLKTAAGM